MSLRAFHVLSLVLSLGFSGAISPSSLRADESPASPFDRGALLTALTRDLTAHYEVGDDLQLDLFRPWVSPVADNSGKSVPAVTVAVVEYPTALASALLVSVRYLQGTKVLREDTLALQAQLWRDVLVARLPLERGSAVTPDALVTRRADALREREVLPATVLGQDLVCTQPLPAGRSLTWRDVTKRSLVRRGDMIEVSATDGQLQITMKAQAMQDGGRGDTVRVRNLESKREFTGQVIADSRVQVNF